MTHFQSGWFAHPDAHHDGWFRLFRFATGVEVWFGHRWFMIAF